MGWKKIFRRYSSGNMAKNRLKMLLITDRTSCSPEVMDLLQSELTQTISKYMDIDPEQMDLQIIPPNPKRKHQNQAILTANIPIKEFRKF